MTSLLWIIGAVALVLLALILYPKRRRPIAKKNRVATPSKPARATQSPPIPLPPLDPIPKAKETAVAKWVILDLQTTGLNTNEGKEARIVEASWAILDEDYRLITRHTYRVRQQDASSPEAVHIHGITDTLHTPFSITEEELLERWFSDLSEDITLVGHNIAFDLAILLGTVRRLTPERIAPLEKLPTFCTMTYLCTSPEIRYPRLVHLTEELTGIPPQLFFTLHPVSWRNVYFTRLCLIHLNSPQKAN